MSRSRPISYRIRKSSTREKQLEKANEWARQWHDQTINLIYRINDNAGNDWDEFEKAVAELRKLTHKKTDALANIFAALTEPLYKYKQE